MKTFLLRSLVATVLLAGASLLLADLFLYPPDHSVMRELKQEGDTIVAAIEEYRKHKSKYPHTLKQAEIKLPQPRYGGWRYALENRGKSFSLTIGDYEQYLFVMGWDSASGEWWLDR